MRGPAHEEDDLGPEGTGRGYLRVVGVGIVVPPGSVQREQHSWAHGLATRWAEGSAQPAGRGLLLSVLGRALARDQMGQEDLPCPKGWLGSVVENQDPKPLPESSPSPLLEGGGGGERAWGSRAFTQSHTQTQREIRTLAHSHINRHTHMATRSHTDTLPRMLTGAPTPHCSPTPQGQHSSHLQAPLHTPVPGREPWLGARRWGEGSYWTLGQR